ncbi:hypothetical protein JTB14_019411 [Gonioctena quinquepunctata]|nr:hypothetical protein JTB14_019411 [Gonioctena quinquepunctata]
MSELIIEDSFQCPNESLNTRLKRLQPEAEPRVEVGKGDTFKTPLVSPVCEGECKEDEDFEIILDKLYGDSWREKQELILPKTEPRKHKTKSVTANTFSERKAKSSVSYKNPYGEEKLWSESLLKTLHGQKLDSNFKSMAKHSKALCNSSTNSERSPDQACPRTKLIFNESSSSDELDDSKTSKYFKNKPKLKDVLRKDSPNKENFDVSDLGQSLEERIRKKMNNIRNPPSTPKSKHSNKSTHSESSPDQARPRTKLNFNESSSSDELDDSKTSKYFKNKPKLKDDLRKDSPNKENFDVSDLGQSLEERIRKKMNNIRNTPSTDRAKEKSRNTKKTPTSNKVNNQITKNPVHKPNGTYSTSSSSSSSSDDKSRSMFITKRKVHKPISDDSISISSDEEWNQEISKIEHRTELRDGTYSFLASLSAKNFFLLVLLIFVLRIIHEDCWLSDT